MGRGLTVNRRNVVIFLALMGMFVTYTQAYTVNTVNTDVELSNINEYSGDDFLTVYSSQPLGKHKILGTLEVTNRLGVEVTSDVFIGPTDSDELTIAAGSVTTYDYKIGSGSWVTASYVDTSAISASVQVTISSGSTETVYVIFEKTDLATTYYMSSIIVQEVGS